MRSLRHAWVVLAGCVIGASGFVIGDEAKKEKDAPKGQETAPAKGLEPFPPPPNLVRLAKDYDIWLDTQRKLVIVDGKVVLREGQLEMFACPKQTKEHESIVAVNCKSQFVHAGLLALGAEPGKPVQFNPEYKPASGPEIDVWVLWKDDRGNHKVKAQEWIQQTKTGKALEIPFVFAGSGFHVDEATGEKHYLADGGDLICVSNFTTATLDLPIMSSQENDALSFRAFTEKIPPIGTPVRLVLAPKLLDKKKPIAETPLKDSTGGQKAKDSSKKVGQPK